MVRYRLFSLFGDWWDPKPTADRKHLAPGSRTLAYGFAFRPEFLIAFILPYVITTLETVGDVSATSQLSDERSPAPSIGKEFVAG